MRRRTFIALVGFFLFAAVLAAIQVVRNRSFWLDEAMVFDSIRLRSAAHILLGGGLNYGQLFPKIYLSLIAALVHMGIAAPTFSARLLPLIFGLSGIAVWFFCFYEFYIVQQEEAIATVVVAGLVVANAYTIYYLFELKQYSAEFFFSGLLLALYQTRRLSDFQRICWLSIATLAAMVFTYAGFLMIIALGLAILFDEDRRTWLEHKNCWAAAFAMGVLLVVFVYRIDLKYGETPPHAGVLHSYWSDSFPKGVSAGQKASSLLDIYKRFITGWWRTEYGPMNEPQAGPGAWYVWPWRTFRNPDIRNCLWLVSLAVILVRLLKRPFGRDLLNAGAWMVIVAAVAACFNIYPWGAIRLSLYLLPVSALLVTESVRWMIAAISRWAGAPLSRLLWLPLVWAILRNAVYLLFVFSRAPLPENLNELPKSLDPRVPYLIVSGESDVIVKSFTKLPRRLTVLYEKDQGPEAIQKTIDHRAAYFLWVHFPPTRDAEGNLPRYRASYREEKVPGLPALSSVGLTLLRPIGQK